MNKSIRKKRKVTEGPFAISKEGMRFHHIGIPTKDRKPAEKYLSKYKLYFSGFDTSEFGVEWMRYEEGSPIAKIIREIPHIAFEVDDLEAAIKGRKIIGEISSPSKGVRVAMILENGAPVEFLEIKKGNKDIRNFVSRQVQHKQ